MHGRGGGNMHECVYIRNGISLSQIIATPPSLPRAPLDHIRNATPATPS